MRNLRIPQVFTLILVYALFTQTKKKALAISRKCLILNVDQPGLEPGTSRL